MTPSKLKEQLMNEWFGLTENRDETFFVEALIDIILEQQAALEKCVLAEKDAYEWGTDKDGNDHLTYCEEALAATAEKLKALGCEGG